MAHKERYMRTMIHLVCAQCGKEFDRYCASINQKRKKGNKNFFCDNSCATKYQMAHRDKSNDNGPDKFWSLVDRRGADECWNWMSPSAYEGGYGSFSYKGKSQRANRLAWQFTYGEIPGGMFVCHQCDNPPCCNPNHLFLGTTQENSKDKTTKGRAKGSNLKGVKNGRSKLTESEVIEIRNLHYIVPGRELAKRFGVCYTTIKDIFAERKYKTTD